MVQTTALDRTSDADSPCYVPAETDLQSVCQGVLSIDMEPVCVHWGFNVGLALVYKSHFMLQYSRHGAAKELMCRTGHYQATLRPTTLGTQA